MLTRCCGLFVVLLILVGPGCQTLPANQSRVVAQRFVQALRGDADARVDASLASDADVFLQGAQTSISPVRFQEYLDVLRSGRQEYQTASRVFVTTTGAGWLLTIGPTADSALVNPPGPPLPAQLWMETTIRDDRITRVWIHFTVEALPRMAVRPEVYRSVAASRGLPVPEGWADGTPALLAAAERTDRLMDGGATDARSRVLIVAVGALAACISLLGARMRWRSRPPRTDQKISGALLENLRKAHSVADATP